MSNLPLTPFHLRGATIETVEVEPPMTAVNDELLVLTCRLPSGQRLRVEVWSDEEGNGSGWLEVTPE